jgi:hypothetical protein
LAIQVKICKLFFDPLTDQLAFQIITSSLDSKVDQHYAIEQLSTITALMAFFLDSIVPVKSSLSGQGFNGWPIAQ